jgi:hypothetical protein
VSEEYKILLNEIKHLRNDFADLKGDFSELKGDLKDTIIEIKDDMKNKCANCSVAKIAKDRLYYIWLAIVAMGGAIWKHITSGN